MTELALPVLSREEARSLTDEVKRDAERLWAKLIELYEGEAHIVLGYSSWRSYYAAEFGGDGSRGDQLLRAGRVMETLGSGENFPLPTNDHQARELAPLLDEPLQMREAWAEVVELHPEPTAADVRAVVRRRLPQQVVMADEREQHATMVRVWDGAVSVLDSPTANAQAKAALLLNYDGPGPITPERLDLVSAFTAAVAAALREGEV